MAIFRESNPFHHDRAAEDRRRHRQLVEKSIKENLPGILSEEAIIGQAGNKKIKIPIRGLKEYEFIFGRRQEGVGSGDGSERRGDKVGEEKQPGQGDGSGQAGNAEGEDIYETEITLDELVDYLFEDLKLPWLDRKRLSETWTEHARKRSGYQRKGVPPRLAKKRIVLEKLRRKQAARRLSREDGTPEPQGRFPFKEDDIRYFRMRETKKRESNAVVFCIMDTSGSMDQSKKYLARSLFFLVYRFVRRKYRQVEVVFIAHSTVAKEVNEQEFFHKVESGGTYLSSGIQLALELIARRYDPAHWNIYAFHASDGDNWSDDNEHAVEAAQTLCAKANLYGYIEIGHGAYGSSIRRLFAARVTSKHYTAAAVERKEDIWPAFQTLLMPEEKEGE